MNSAGSSVQSHFSKVPSANIQRSVFNRSSTLKTTLNAGYLYPVFVDEVLPGDTASLKMNILARLATPEFPYMDNLLMDLHFWFVPNRLVWTNWERFMGAQNNPTDSISYLVPQLDATTYAAGGFPEGSIHDYFGLPMGVLNIPQADMPNCLVHRAYNLIWNQWYRDENLQNSLTVSLTDGPDSTAFALQRRGRRKDYFTSSLPFVQKFATSYLPLSGNAPVKYENNFGSGGTAADDKYVVASTSAGTGNVDFRYGNTANANTGRNPDGSLNNMYADLTVVTAATINDIRTAVTLQQFYERDARGGTRYVELLLSHFGVVSPDFRLQRAEYLGGGTFPINVNPIAQTSETAAGTPQGNLAAFAVAKGNGRFNHSFVEHGHIIGLVSVRADVTYQQGLNRSWSRRTRYDFYWPEFANLGEQPVYNKEIEMVGSLGITDNQAFGYQERYAEYRYKPSMVTGLFRSTAAASLDAWHLALDFGGTPPTLAGLIPENPPVDRIVQVTSQPQFILDTFTELKHVRPMPTYSVPGLSRF